MTGAYSTAAERWLRTWSDRTSPDIRLFCFPHGGGSAGYFRSWSRFLPPSVELTAIQYPGRQDRLAEPFVGDMAELADALAGFIAPRCDRPVVFFGHSLGAVVAFETARRLHGAGGQGAGPVHLLASASRAPSVPSGIGAHLGDDDAVLAFAQQLGGTDAEVLANPELRELVLPVLVADLRMLNAYRYADGPPLPCPITVLTAEDDERVTWDAAESWRRHTTADFAHHVLPGGHFYLQDLPDGLTRQVLGALNVTPPVPPVPPSPRPRP